MSVRIRAILVIVMTNLVIILFSVFTGIRYVRENMEKSIETDLTVVADIADHFVSSEIESLKLKATDMARSLTPGRPEEWPGILEETRALYPEFIGAAIFSGERKLAFQTGEQPATAEVVDDAYVRRAFLGERVLSSTKPRAGRMVFYLAVPVPDSDNSILTVTLPGMYFSERVSTFVIWETGHIFLDDSEGYVVANIREEWVENRFNFIRMAEANSDYDGIASVIKEMIRGRTGIARFSIDGVPRICAYRPVSGSNAGWCLGVVAPLPESPVRNIDRGLLMVGFVGILLGVVAAVVASGFIKKPFEEIAALKEVAEESSKSKTNFLASMSHEMRTPLNAVIGLSQLALDGNIDGEDRENIEKVYSAGITLLSIINDILDISKIESNKFDLNLVEYDLPSMINDAVVFNTMRIGEKPIIFKLYVDETLPARLLGDDLRVKQIFNNVLSNAFKYTQAGTVQWRILWDRSGDDVWIISSVSDTGIGIRPEDMGKLFVNYSQVNSGSNRKIEGTGLGLALTKRMLELMDGSISVESEYGKGSTFSFRIKQGFVTGTPIGQSVAESLMNFRYTNHKQKNHSKFVRVRLPYARVLVVDDILPNLAVVKGIMKPYGMQVDCVTSGEEAVRLIREGVKYNAIFMDHMMPGMNGIEATRIIRSEIGTDYARNVPVIALTANAIRGNEEMFLNSGFQAFLSKPIDIVQMDAVIRQWVRDKEQEKNIAREADASETAAEGGKRAGIAGVDLDMVLEQLDGDEETLVEVLKIYVEQVPAVLERLKSVAEAEPPAASGSPRAAEEELPPELSAYVIDVHGIKGISRNIYAEKVSAMAEALEHAGKAGDFAFIREHNGALIEAVEKLTASIQAWLDSK